MVAKLPLADRQAQYGYADIDRMRDEVTRDGLEPANTPEYAAVAGSRDLAGEPVGTGGPDRHRRRLTGQGPRARDRRRAWRRRRRTPAATA
jgi:hypothetical protein